MKPFSGIFRTYSTLSPEIRGNVFRLNIIKFSKWFSLVMPVIVPFYKDMGLSITEIMMLKSVYSIVIVALELPSGYFADVLGRKKTLIIGAFLGAIGFLIYAFSGSYAGFFVAEIALGAGQSFISGADSAMLYDTLSSGRRENEYTRYEGINASVGNFSEAFSGLAGGAIALISLRLPFYAQAAIAATAIPAALTLVEPEVAKKDKKSGLRDIIKILDTIIIKEKNLRFNLLFSSIIGAATLLMAWFAQPLFEKMLLPLALYGTVWTSLNLITGGSSIVAHRIEKRLGESATLKTIAILIPVLMVFTGIVPIYAIIPLLVIFYFLRGVATPVLKDYINKNTGSEVRATVMSLRDMVIRIFFSLFAPLAGWLSDNYNLGTGLAVSGGFILCLSLITLICFFKSGRKS
ncbi:MAG TPA: MFS transporter [Bacteroidales bacterium]|nr:MFS transporter [Bacteroidales bacterium]